MTSNSLENGFKNLLASIRVKQNNFIYQLQEYKNKPFTTLTSANLHKQKVQSEKLDQLLEKIGKIKGIHVNKFWDKLLSLYSLSLQRIQLLSLNTPTMIEHYNQIFKTLKSFKNDIQCFQNISRIQYLATKKLYYAMLGKYSQDLKIIEERDSIRQSKILALSPRSSKTISKKFKQYDDLKPMGSIKPGNQRSNCHFKGLEDHFDIRRYCKKLKMKAKSLQIAFQQLQARNTNIYKTINRVRSIQKQPSEYFQSQSSYIQKYQKTQTSYLSDQEWKKSLKFQPEFGKSRKLFKYGVIIHGSQRKRIQNYCIN